MGMAVRLSLAIAVVSIWTAIVSAFARPAIAATEPAFGCSASYQDWKKKRQHQRYAAFAKGKAFTITGMMGCGYSWGQKTQAQADAIAIRFCREKARNPDQCYISDRTKAKK